MYQPCQGVYWHRESFNDQFDCKLPAEARIELLEEILPPHDLSHQRRTSRLSTSTSASAAGDQSASDSAAGRSLRLESASPQRVHPEAMASQYGSCWDSLFSSACCLMRSQLCVRRYLTSSKSGSVHVWLKCASVGA
jgi:hypothetical protein